MHTCTHSSIDVLLPPTKPQARAKFWTKAAADDIGGAIDAMGIEDLEQFYSVVASRVAAGKATEFGGWGRVRSPISDALGGGGATPRRLVDIGVGPCGPNVVMSDKVGGGGENRVSTSMLAHMPVLPDINNIRKHTHNT